MVLSEAPDLKNIDRDGLCSKVSGRISLSPGPMIRKGIRPKQPEDLSGAHG